MAILRQNDLICQTNLHNASENPTYEAHFLFQFAAELSHRAKYQKYMLN